MATETLPRNAARRAVLDQPQNGIWRRSTEVRKLYAGTVLTESAVLISQIIAYKMAASHLGKEGFSEYALARRTLSLLQPAAILGLNVALPRYMAFSAGRRPASSPDNYFASGLLIVACALSVALTLLNLLKGSTAFLFFGSAQYRSLIPAVALLLLGLTLHMACEGYFRGGLAMNKANILRFINLGLMPILVFLVFGNSPQGVLTALGAAIGVTSAVTLLFTHFSSGMTHLLLHARELLLYGLGRVPADLMQLAFISLPAILMAHLQGVESAGLVAFGISVLTMLCSLFPPVSSVLLPEASQMISRGDIQGLKRRVTQILMIAIVIVTLSVTVLEVFARPIFRLYLGPSFNDAVGIVRIVILGAVPYAIYLGLRSVLDAFSVAPINSKNMLISFTAFLVGAAAVYFKQLPPVYVLAAFVAALYILGILTLYEIRKICYGPKLQRGLSAQIPAPAGAVDAP